MAEKNTFNCFYFLCVKICSPLPEKEKKKKHMKATQNKGLKKLIVLHYQI